LAKCANVGEKKDQASMAVNPMVSLGGGLQHKVLGFETGDRTSQPVALGKQKQIQMRLQKMLLKR
jgi:hypothetical protein